MIKIYSTYTKDIIYDIKNRKEITRNGGPAFFIENVFKKNKVKYEIQAGNSRIKIELNNGIEKGVLDGSVETKEIASAGKNDTIVISTVDNEWIPNVNKLRGAHIFMDIQGYVRNSRKNPEIFKANFWDEIYCMKTNDKEMKELPHKIIENQKKKFLIITKGDKGADVYFCGKKYHFKADKIEAPDYIGAGDTFFANFIMYYLKKNGNIVDAGNQASAAVGRFLKKKRIQ